MNRPVSPLRISARRAPGLLGRFGAVWRDAAALLLSLADKRTPTRSRLIALLALLYAVSPLDLIPDSIPLLGVTDDLLIVPAVLAYAARSLPAPVLMQARGKVARLPRLPRLWPLLLGLVGLLYGLSALLSYLN